MGEIDYVLVPVWMLMEKVASLMVGVAKEKNDRRLIGTTVAPLILLPKPPVDLPPQ